MQRWNLFNDVADGVALMGQCDFGEKGLDKMLRNCFQTFGTIHFSRVPYCRMDFNSFLSQLSIFISTLIKYEKTN